MFRSQDIQVFVFLTNSWSRREKKICFRSSGLGKKTQPGDREIIFFVKNYSFAIS